MRRKGLNRIGNLLVPNDNYCKFEDWVVPILDKMVEEQEGEERVKWSPSRVIERLGKEIDDESSILYWAQKVRSLCSCRGREKLTYVYDCRTKFPSSALPSRTARSAT